MKTFSAKAEEVNRDWYVVDATNKTLGRLSTEIARRLRGGYRRRSQGDFVASINLYIRRTLIRVTTL